MKTDRSFSRSLSELAELIPLLILMSGPLVILLGCIEQNLIKNKIRKSIEEL